MDIVYSYLFISHDQMFTEGCYICPTRACFTLPQLSRHATLKLSTDTWPSRFQSSGRTRATILGSLQWWVRNWWRVGPTRCDSYAKFCTWKWYSARALHPKILYFWWSLWLTAVKHDGSNACRETQRFSKCLVNVQGATTTTCLKVRFWNQ